MKIILYKNHRKLILKCCLIFLTFPYWLSIQQIYSAALDVTDIFGYAFSDYSLLISGIIILLPGATAVTGLLMISKRIYQFSNLKHAYRNFTLTVLFKILTAFIFLYPLNSSYRLNLINILFFIPFLILDLFLMIRLINEKKLRKLAFFTWLIVLLFCSYFVISGFVLAAEFPEVLCCPV